MPWLAAIPAILTGDVLRQLLDGWHGHRQISLSGLRRKLQVFLKRSLYRASERLVLPNYVDAKHGLRCVALKIGKPALEWLICTMPRVSASGRSYLRNDQRRRRHHVLYNARL